jgi:hypothetical protein
VELTIGQNFTLHEVSSPVANVQLIDTPFQMDTPNKQVMVVNQVTVPNTGYSA